MRAPLDGKDVLAVSLIGYGESLIYQIQDIKSIGHSAADIRELTVSEIRQCNFKVMFASAEKIKEKTFRTRVHRYIKVFVLLQVWFSLETES